MRPDALLARNPASNAPLPPLSLSPTPTPGNVHASTSLPSTSADNSLPVATDQAPNSRAEPSSRPGLPRGYGGRRRGPVVSFTPSLLTQATGLTMATLPEYNVHAANGESYVAGYRALPEPSSAPYPPPVPSSYRFRSK
jgi:hypothetical protein